MNAQAHDHAHGHHDHDHGDHDHDLDYVGAILDGRAAKDHFFATSPHSPIRTHAHDHGSSTATSDAPPPFDGLAYFDPDPAYQFHVTSVLPYERTEPVEFEMTTSDGRVRTAFRTATLPFELDGQALRLHAYRFAGSPEGSLFVPFQDATSGVETYGAARYLDLELEDDGSVVLDFNLAYHPYCAYNEAYSCPLPPAENRLPVRIAAGERLPT